MTAFSPKEERHCRRATDPKQCFVV